MKHQFLPLTDLVWQFIILIGVFFFPYPDILSW